MCIALSLYTFYILEEIQMEEKNICICCGCEIPEDEVYYINDEPICQDCLNEECSICEHCGDVIWNDDSVHDEHTILCTDCFNNHYYRCYECGDIIHENEIYWHGNEPYCEQCYDNRCDDYINDYSYKPEPIFYNSSNNNYITYNNQRYYGVELEIDKGGKYDEYAENILYIGNKSNEHIYIKSDSSLDDGFEIVSHPMTLEYHLNEMQWQEVIYEAKALGYRSHDTSTCGLHIHIGRNELGNTYDQQEEIIAKIIYFIELHWNEMLKFSRRTQSNMNRWSARIGYETTSKKILHKAKETYNRYVAVNLLNRSTVEIRMFRGTLKYNTFVATLQIVDKIVDIAINLTDEEIDNLSWSEFVSTLDKEKYSQLIQYLKERNLYINEPIVVESEV